MKSAREAKFNRWMSNSNSAVVEQERLRVSESVKNIIAREQQRDEQLQTRIKKINEKQAARIKEIEDREAKNQRSEFQRLVQQAVPQKERTSARNKNEFSTVEQSEGSPMVDSVDARPSQTARESKGDKYIPLQHAQSQNQLPTTESTKFFSASKKDYFNNNGKPQHQNLFGGLKHGRQESTQGHPGSRLRKEETLPTSSSVLSQIKQRPLNTSTHTISVLNRSKLGALGGKDRADVSFLQEKANAMYSENLGRKVPLEPHQNALLSQQKLTSGDEGKDEYI